jgi:phycobilisome rod-core linker protein
VGSEESPRQRPQGSSRHAARVDELIEQAYRQIFFHAFKIDRGAALESQLRSGQITLRDFVRGLLLSSKFRDDFYRCNSNTRMVDQIVGRALCRQVHGERERIALSILIAQKGLPGLIDRLLDSEEYLDTFGLEMVPYQRSRTLAGRSMGALPFNQQAPRYDAYWRETLAQRSPAGKGTAWTPTSGFSLPRPAWLADAPPMARCIWQGLMTVGGFAITALFLYTAATMLSTAGAG